MDDDWLEKSSLVKFAGFALGILIGGPIGPLVFKPAGLSVSAAATAGSFFGAILGYAATSGLIIMERRRRDRELQEAADAVRIEARMPESVTLKVEDQHITLEGEVEDYNEWVRTEQVISSLPGIKGITNRIRVKLAAGQMTASPDEIMSRIRDSLVRRAELDGRRIRVLVNNSRVVLEGTVQSPAEACEAENVAWNIPGVVEVENRLKIAA
jgi:osmotically-inducible protein OsmY